MVANVVFNPSHLMSSSNIHGPSGAPSYTQRYPNHPQCAHNIGDDNRHQIVPPIIKKISIGVA